MFLLLLRSMFVVSMFLNCEVDGEVEVGWMEGKGLTDGRNRTQCLLNVENGLQRSSGVLLTCVASALLVSCVR